MSESRLDVTNTKGGKGKDLCKSLNLESAVDKEFATLIQISEELYNTDDNFRKLVDKWNAMPSTPWSFKKEKE